jgi:DNA-binding protein H-NS
MRKSAKSLGSMSVDALVKLRAEIGDVLSRKAQALKAQLASLGSDYAEVGRIALYGRKKSRAGQKVPAKYRHPKTGMTWAGRGMQPVWLREEIKKGAKRDDFLIAKRSKVAASRKKLSSMKTRRKKR